MIRLQIERFDEANRILALREAEGECYLFIGFGEKEATEIGRAMRLEPFATDINTTIWMEMIEERGAQLDSVAIVDLVDGVFKASVYLTQEGRSFDIPARPAEAIAWALRHGLPVFATEETLRITACPKNLDTIYPFLSGPVLKFKGDDIGQPVATFHEHLPAKFLRTSNMIRKSIGAFLFLFGILMIGTTLPYLISHAVDGDLAKVQRDLSWFLPMYALLGAALFLLFHLHHFHRDGGARLEIFPFGARVSMGKIEAAIVWSSFEKPGKPAWFAPKIEGLVSKTRRFGAGGLGLSQYEKDWREGEIGNLIRRYSPRLLGSELVDPEGGRHIFA
jgi:bifunctional DNase/RNase